MCVPLAGLRWEQWYVDTRLHAKYGMRISFLENLKWVVMLVSWYTIVNEKVAHASAVFPSDNLRYWATLQLIFPPIIFSLIAVGVLQSCEVPLNRLAVLVILLDIGEALSIGGLAKFWSVGWWKTLGAGLIMKAILLELLLQLLEIILHLKLCAVNDADNRKEWPLRVEGMKHGPHGPGDPVRAEPDTGPRVIHHDESIPTAQNYTSSGNSCCIQWVLQWLKAHRMAWDLLVSLLCCNSMQFGPFAACFQPLFDVPSVAFSHCRFLLLIALGPLSVLDRLQCLRVAKNDHCCGLPSWSLHNICLYHSWRVGWEMLGAHARSFP